MIEGEPRPQEIVLIIRFLEVIDERTTRQTVLLFENSKGQLSLPSIRTALDDDILVKIGLKYGLDISNSGKVKIVDRQKEGLNVILLDYQGIMGSFKSSDKYKPLFFPYDDIEEILENEDLTKVTQKVLILYLTKLALNGRLC